MALHGKLFIGSRLGTGTGKTRHPTSPLNQAALEPGFYQAQQEDVDAVMTLAAAAFAGYREFSGRRRAEFLEAIGEAIQGLGDELIDRAHWETGLPAARLIGERTRTVNQLRMFAAVAREGSWVDARIERALPERQPLPRPDLRRMLLPIGPVVVFGSSNFPLAFSTAGGDVASALATGNSVVVKAHSAHPGTGELVARAILRAAQQCGLPDGVFSMVHGSGSEIGVALVRHPATKAVGFTGSRAAGRALFDAAAARPEPIPVFAEMSSLNPVFILPRALRERGTQIAEGLQSSVTMGVGQLCTKPGLIFGVAGPELGSFEQALKHVLSGSNPATMLHRGIYQSFQEGIDRASGVPGVSVLGQGGRPADKAKTEAGALVLKTDVETFRRHPELSEEVFGPCAVVIEVPHLEGLLQLAAELEGQLTATLHGTPEDLAEARSLVKLLEQKAGRLIVNGFPTGVEVGAAMNHGGPYPATTDVRFTSVGTAALLRFVRPVCYQNFPESLLPDELKDSNPLGIKRLEA